MPPVSARSSRWVPAVLASLQLGIVAVGGQVVAVDPEPLRPRAAAVTGRSGVPTSEAVLAVPQVVAGPLQATGSVLPPAAPPVQAPAAGLGGVSMPAAGSTGAPTGPRPPSAAPTSRPRSSAAPPPVSAAPPAPPAPPAARANAFAASRSGDFESGFEEWDLGGASVQPNPGSSVARDTASAYTGSYGARASIAGGGGNKFARTLWGNSPGQSGALDYGEGKDFSYGMALYLPVGFHADMQSYFVPMRWDNFGVTNVSRSGISMWQDGTLRLFRERAGLENQTNLLGTTSFRLSEGQWHWLEVRQKLSSRDGSALNELWVDGRLVGSSTTRNYYGEPVSAIRYGIVAIADGAQTAPLTVHYDRAVLGTGRLGPR